MDQSTAMILAWIQAMEDAQPQYGPLLQSTVDKVGYPAIDQSGVIRTIRDDMTYWGAVGYMRGFARSRVRGMEDRALANGYSEFKRAGNEEGMVLALAKAKFYESFRQWIESHEPQKLPMKEIPEWLLPFAHQVRIEPGDVGRPGDSGHVKIRTAPIEYDSADQGATVDHDRPDSKTAGDRSSVEEIPCDDPDEPVGLTVADVLEYMPDSDRAKISPSIERMFALEDEIDDEILAVAPVELVGSGSGPLLVTPTRLILIKESGGIRVIRFSDVDGITIGPGRKKLFGGSHPSYMMASRRAGDTLNFVYWGDHYWSQMVMAIVLDAHEKYLLRNT